MKLHLISKWNTKKKIDTWTKKPIILADNQYSTEITHISCILLSKFKKRLFYATKMV